MAEAAQQELGEVDPGVCFVVVRKQEGLEAALDRCL